MTWGLEVLDHQQEQQQQQQQGTNEKKPVHFVNVLNVGQRLLLGTTTPLHKLALACAVAAL